MLERCTSAQERWGGVDDIIDRWLNERKELLVKYCTLQEIKPFNAGTEPPSVRIQDFCQVMIDYLSAGHFEVYEQLLNEAREFNDGTDQHLETIYPAIQTTTERCLTFNDKYDTKGHCLEHLAEVARELSELGEVLAERFELEDQLIEKVHKIHGSKSTANVTSSHAS